MVKRVMSDGGYDDGYKSCPCFWGDEPGSLVTRLSENFDFQGKTVLDIGGGEGKNAVYLADRGARVEVWDVSSCALENGQKKWPLHPVTWVHKNALDLEAEARKFDLIIAYGLLHCLAEEEIASVVAAMKTHLRASGRLIIVAFNSRSQDIEEAHPGFNPTLLPHSRYLGLFEDWVIEESSDSDLTETHPHNGIEHTHSMTRLIVRHPAHG